MSKTTPDTPPDAMPGVAAKADFRLNEHLPYLLARTTGRIALQFSRRTSAEGLTLRMWRVLTVLSEYAELRLSDIAHLTAIDMSTLSKLITAMHKRRLIGRRRSTRSKREILITLAPMGEEILARLIPQARDFEAAMLRGIEPGDMAAAKTVLRLIFENLAELGDKTAGDGLLRTL